MKTGSEAAGFLTIYSVLSKDDNRIYECYKDDKQILDNEKIPDSIGETLRYDDPEESIQYHTQQTEDSEALFHGQGVTDRDND